MSRKSRERREKNKAVRPDDYFSNGIFEIARFGKNTIVRNNQTKEQHAAQMAYLRTEYTAKYENINQKVKSLKENVAKCDPYSLLTPSHQGTKKYLLCGFHWSMTAKTD